MYDLAHPYYGWCVLCMCVWGRGEDVDVPDTGLCVASLVPHCRVLRFIHHTHPLPTPPHLIPFPTIPPPTYPAQRANRSRLHPAAETMIATMPQAAALRANKSAMRVATTARPATRSSAVCCAFRCESIARPCHLRLALCIVVQACNGEAWCLPAQAKPWQQPLPQNALHWMRTSEPTLYPACISHLG